MWYFIYTKFPGFLGVEILEKIKLDLHPLQMSRVGSWAGERSARNKNSPLGNPQTSNCFNSTIKLLDLYPNLLCKYKSIGLKTHLHIVNSGSHKFFPSSKTAKKERRKYKSQELDKFVSTFIFKEVSRTYTYLFIPHCLACEKFTELQKRLEDLFIVGSHFPLNISFVWKKKKAGVVECG